MTAMTLKKAVGLAMKSMQKELQRFAFDASMYRDYGMEGFAYGKRAAKRVEELKEAQGVLLALVNGESVTKGDGGPVIWLTEGGKGGVDVSAFGEKGDSSDVL